MKHLRHQIPAVQRGFTLVELLIALVLGLLVIGAAGSIFLQNRRVYGSTETVNRIQENQRSAFELLARDIREAGGNPCQRFSATSVPVNLPHLQIKAPNTTFWSRFSDGAFGVDGSGAGGSDAITLYSASSTVYNVTQHKKPDDPLTVSTKTVSLVNGQPLMVCNTDTAIVFAANGVTSSGYTIGHDGSANCGTSLSADADYTQCALSSVWNGYCFQPDATPDASCKLSGQSPSFVTVPVDSQWTVAANGRGTNSLYRTQSGNRSEIAEGIISLRLTYKMDATSNYVSAAAVTAANAWSQVTAVHMLATFQAAQGAMAKGDNKGTDNAVLTRTLDDYVVLRNHQSIQ